MESTKKTYSVTFNYPNGDSFSVLETENINEAIEKFEKTSPEDANHPDFRDAEEINVELRKYEDGEITDFNENEVEKYPQRGWIIK